MYRRNLLDGVVTAGILAVGSLAGAELANSYDFTVCSHIGAQYVHVHTVSAFCHDRTPVDNTDPPLTGDHQCVDDSTAPGCLIDNVTFVTDGKQYSWSGIGVPGGTFTLQWPGLGDPFVCFNGERDDCL